MAGYHTFKLNLKFYLAPVRWRVETTWLMGGLHGLGRLDGGIIVYCLYLDVVRKDFILTTFEEGETLYSIGVRVEERND